MRRRYADKRPLGVAHQMEAALPQLTRGRSVYDTDSEDLVSPDNREWEAYASVSR